MVDSVNNYVRARASNILNIPSAGADRPTGRGDARDTIDRSALGKPLPAAPSFGASFLNGASRHFDGQNLYGGMTKAGNPYVSSDDHVLATALMNNWSLLDAFKKDGQLTQASLQEIAKEEPSSSKVSERTIMLALEILNRPRLNDAILEKGGKITYDSLGKAADLQVGNTNPNTQSADPFHAKTDAQVVKSLRGMFDELRDKSKDWTFFFDKHRYLKTDLIIEMSMDPDQTDKNGEPVRDARTRVPLKKYTEYQVYLGKNLRERPGLLASLDSHKANGHNIFGSHNDDGWIKNYSVDRWLKNDKKEKGR
ncbi:MULTISPECIES: hypothetical protein [unclassified Pseudomonas]|uniref:hypothetical protein n=1 Tax=unclassified Pseudomonas TaxID=196821 RepID=UPI0008E7F9CD|nr:MULTISPECIES: hypothetical protein [unclassified Pseudomonas]SFB44163.1 hypothetical protein SAMN03159485_05618 [Pseudomonas sp. NFPP24]SFP42103.1 hypothetical protein SAMN03159315_03198 [Pseudomonas sp. NFPP28]